MEGWGIGIIVAVIIAVLEFVQWRRSHHEIKRLRDLLQQLYSRFRERPKKAKGLEKGYAYKFIRDVTIPDGSEVEVGEEFVKIWEIQNTGSVTWERCYLQREGACAGPGLVSSAARVRVPRAKPRERVQIRIKMKAPLTPGTTTCKWEMVDIDGNMCFPERPLSLFITVNVVKKD